MDTTQIVSRDPELMGGELVFSGTRVPVKTLVDYLKAGDGLEEFLDEFPTVARYQAVGYLEISVEAVDQNLCCERSARSGAVSPVKPSRAKT